MSLKECRPTSGDRHWASPSLCRRCRSGPARAPSYLPLARPQVSGELPLSTCLGTYTPSVRSASSQLRCDDIAPLSPSVGLEEPASGIGDHPARQLSFQMESAAHLHVQSSTPRRIHLGR